MTNAEEFTIEHGDSSSDAGILGDLGLGRGVSVPEPSNATAGEEVSEEAPATPATTEEVPIIVATGPRSRGPAGYPQYAEACRSAEVSGENCPVCNYEFGSAFAVTPKGKYFECHLCQSVWCPTIAQNPVMKSKAGPDGKGVILYGSLSFTGSLVDELNRQDAPGSITLVENAFRNGRTLVQLNWQDAFASDPKVIPTRDGVATAAAHAGFDVIALSPSPILRKSPAVPAVHSV